MKIHQQVMKEIAAKLHFNSHFIRLFEESDMRGHVSIGIKGLLAVHIIFFSLLFGCSTTPKENTSEDPSAKKEEPPKKTKTITYRCSISNGAGRMFYANASSQYVAESKARRECAATYRNCIFLGCNETEEE